MSLVRFLCLALCGECGELANEAKKQWRDGSDRRALMVAELADIGNYAFMLAEALGINLEKEMLAKLIEVERRPEWRAVDQAIVAQASQEARAWVAGG
jgi:NTP pyrophosphatase (non-canonical NTP hydrolase)